MHTTGFSTDGEADSPTGWSDGDASLVRRVAGRFGVDARNLFERSTDPGVDGALAALETFYFALNNGQLDLITATWAANPLVQLNNPLGGIIRGRSGVTALYERLFRSQVGLTVTLSDIGMYADEHHVVFAGRENGTFVEPATGAELEIEIRTTRYFRNEPDVHRWQQFHHHGSVDDAAVLAAYRGAVADAADREVRSSASRTHD